MRLSLFLTSLSFVIYPSECIDDDNPDPVASITKEMDLNRMLMEHSNILQQKIQRLETKQQGYIDHIVLLNQKIQELTSENAGLKQTIAFMSMQVEPVEGRVLFNENDAAAMENPSKHQPRKSRKTQKLPASIDKSLYKTKDCWHFSMKGKCPFKNCAFIHNDANFHASTAM